MTNWPDPARPGVPLNPEKDGWHWIKARSDNLKATWREKFPAQWTAGNRHWIHGTYAPEYAAENWLYLGPVLTPDEATALQKRVTELEEALGTLEKAASYTAKLGAVTGAHWLGLGTALIKARAALEGKKDE